MDISEIKGHRIFENKVIERCQAITIKKKAGLEISMKYSMKYSMKRIQCKKCIK